jgi:hypothetical protein
VVPQKTARKWPPADNAMLSAVKTDDRADVKVDRTPLTTRLLPI